MFYCFNCASDGKLFLMSILALPVGSYASSFLSQPNMNHLQEYESADALTVSTSTQKPFH